MELQFTGAAEEDEALAGADRRLLRSRAVSAPQPEGGESKQQTASEVGFSMTVTYKPVARLAQGHAG